MKKIDFENVLINAKYHASVMWRGFARTLYGASVAGLILVAGYGFVVIQSEEGYAAVFDFVLAASALFVALCNMYVMGKKKRGAKK